MIKVNIIHAAQANNVQRLLFLGSSCIHLKFAEQPMIEKVANVIGSEWGITKPEGTTCKLLDVSRLDRRGWKVEIGLEEGLRDAHHWFLQYKDDFRS